MNLTLNIRCDECGQFVPPKDIDKGIARRVMATPDSDLSTETWETLCKRHYHPPVVAWSVEINSMTTIVFAPGPSQARWLAVKGYWDAYGRKRSWPHCSVRREERFDDSPFKADKGRCWSPDYLAGGYDEAFPTRA